MQIPEDIKSTSPINRSLILRPDQASTCCATFALNNEEGEAQTALRLVWFAQTRQSSRNIIKTVLCM
jgi:hypothetical protein